MKTKNQYPKTEIEATEKIEQIKQLLMDHKTDNNFKKLSELLQVKYRGKIAKAENKTKHYGKYSNKHTVITYHTMIGLFFNIKCKKCHVPIVDIIYKPKKQSEGFYLTLKTLDNHNLHHEIEQGDEWVKARDFMHNLTGMHYKEHNKKHNGIQSH